MSVAAPPSGRNPRPGNSPPPPGRASRSGGGFESVIESRIEEACRALWWSELTRSILAILLTLAAVLLGWVLIDQWVVSAGRGLRLAVFAAAVGWAGWYVWRRIVPLMRSRVRPEYAARSLERDLPEMRQELTSYVTLRDGELPGLSNTVVRSIGARAAHRLRLHESLPLEATGTLRWWIATAAILALLVVYAAWSPKNTFQSASRLAAPLASIDPARRVSIRDVEPGDTDATAGRSLDVSARVDGLAEGESVWCHWVVSGRRESRELSREESTGRFSTRVELEHTATGTVLYRIEAGDAVAGPYRWQLADVPVVALQSVHYQPPDYTRREDHTSSSGSITAIDGTRVTVRATTNRPVDQATLELNPREVGGEIRATAGAKEMELGPERRSLEITFPLRSHRNRAAAVKLQSYRVRVTDPAGQSNPEPIVYPIRVIDDLVPDVAIVVPKQTPKKIPIDAQQVIEIHASDPDFGLTEVGLEIRRGIDVIARSRLWSDAEGARGNQVTDYRFRPTAHGLRPGDVVEIRANATDNRASEIDPRIEPNTSWTDPVELRIVRGDPMSDTVKGDDGLSTPENAEQAADNQNASQSDSAGEPAGSGGAKSGGGSQPSESAADAGDSSSEGQSEGQSGEGQSGQGQSGDGSQSSAESTSGQSGGSSGDGSGESAEAASPQGGGESSAGESQRSQSPGSDQTPSGGGGEASAEQSGGQNPAAPDGTGDRSAAEPSGAGGTESSGNAAAADSPASASDGRPPEGGASPRGGQSGGSDESRPPEHPGEAFERIKEYLDEKQQSQPGDGGDAADSGDGGKASEGANGSPSGDARPDTGEPSDPDDGAAEREPQGAGGERPDGDREAAGDRGGTGGDQASDQKSAESKSGEEKSGSGQSAGPDSGGLGSDKRDRAGG